MVFLPTSDQAAKNAAFALVSACGVNKSFLKPEEFLIHAWLAWWFSSTTFLAFLLVSFHLFPWLLLLSRSLKFPSLSSDSHLKPDRFARHYSRLINFDTQDLPCFCPWAEQTSFLGPALKLPSTSWEYIYTTLLFFLPFWTLFGSNYADVGGYFFFFFFSVPSHSGLLRWKYNWLPHL